MSLIINTNKEDLLDTELMGVYAKSEHILVKVLRCTYKHPEQYDEFGVSIVQIETKEVNIKKISDWEKSIILKNTLPLALNAENIIKTQIE